jgi:hypothetical protein
MSKQLARLLRADIQETSDLKSIAKMLANKGRGGDTMLAHITPKEVELLKDAGGAGTVNPETGLLEFYDEYSSEQIAPGPEDMASSSQQFDNSNSNFNPDNATFGNEQVVGVPSASPESVYYNQPGASMADIPESAQSADMRGRGDTYMANQALYGQRPGEAEFMKQRGEGPVGTSPSTFQKYVADPYKEFKESTGITGADILRVGGAGAGAYFGRKQSQQAAKQIQAAKEEQQKLAAPYQQQGRDLVGAAQRGELTASGQQQLQALQAQLNQGAESRGGVGVAQAAAQAQAFRNQLLQNQYDYGLKVSQIGDNIALGAIRTGMQLDQQLNQANLAFYTQLGSIAAGIPTYRRD